MLMRRITVWLLVVGVAACGGDLTLTEYATRIEAAVAAMNVRVDELDVAIAESASMDEVWALWDQRVAAREELVAEARALDPPESAAEMHEVAVDIMGRLAATEAAMRVHAEDETITHLGEVWDTAEGQAARAVDEEAIAICQAAQAFFDGTADRQILAEVPWISSELKEVVEVAFGCTAAERGTG